MPTDFFRSNRSLHQDGYGGTLLRAAIATVLLGAWCAWFFGARLTLYAVTESARIELDRAVHSIESPVAGRVTTTTLMLGQDVRAGELLVALESENEKRRLDEERTRITGLSPQIDALRREISEQEQALQEAAEAASAGVNEASARVREAEAGATFAESELARLTTLHTGGHLSDTELESARASAEEKRAIADRVKLAADRLKLEQRTEASDRRAHLEQLRREVTRLEGDRASAEAAVRSLEQEIEQHLIRAPVAGRVVEIADLQAGAFADEGDKLAVVAAPGQLKAVANYPPASAMGRIQPGQEARLRLEGFPWTQYGSLTASVTRVASELREGRVRVEMAIHPDSGSTIPLQHGLPATAEVKVERATPATLVLRAVGKLLAKPSAASATPPASRGTR